MEAIMLIILQIFCATRAVSKIGEYSRIFPSFSWGIFGHVTRLDQPRERKYVMDYKYTIYASYAMPFECIPYGNYKRPRKYYWQVRFSVVCHEKAVHNFHAIQNTMAHTINAIYAQRMMGRLGVIPSRIQRPSYILIGCIDGININSWI